MLKESDKLLNLFHEGLEKEETIRDAGGIISAGGANPAGRTAWAMFPKALVTAEGYSGEGNPVGVDEGRPHTVDGWAVLDFRRLLDR